MQNEKGMNLEELRGCMVMGVQQQRNPQDTKCQCDFQVALKKKQPLNECVFICGAFFMSPNKLHFAPLKRK